MFRKNLFTAIIAIGLIQAASSHQKTLSQGSEGVEPRLDSIENDELGAGRWLGLNTGLTLVGSGELLSFDAANSRAEYRIFDDGNGGVCRVRAYIGTLFFFFDFQASSQLFCSQAVIARITQQGHVLFLDPRSGQYSYTTQSFRQTSVLQAQGDVNLEKAFSAGVQIAATKSYAKTNQENDAFRIYSKASDSERNYPENFYYIESNAARNSFVKSFQSTLTFKASNWGFKNTTTSTRFQHIDAVNFIPDQAPASGDEAQFIMGTNHGQNTCLFGVVNTYRFYKGPA